LGEPKHAIFDELTTLFLSALVSKLDKVRSQTLPVNSLRSFENTVLQVVDLDSPLNPLVEEDPE